jgi:hypothetical protein
MKKRKPKASPPKRESVLKGRESLSPPLPEKGECSKKLRTLRTRRTLRTLKTKKNNDNEKK